MGFLANPDYRKAYIALLVMMPLGLTAGGLVAAKRIADDPKKFELAEAQKSVQQHMGVGAVAGLASTFILPPVKALI
jgi:hypothetical protein